MTLVEKRNPLDKRSDDRPTLKEGIVVLPENRSVDISFWIHLHQLGEDFLRSSPVGDPVGYECYIFRFFHALIVKEKRKGKTKKPYMK